MTKEYVITGGACSGKTSLIEKFEERGYKTIPESARIIAREEKLRPWENFEEFQRRTMERQLSFEEEIKKSGYDKIFLDRSPIDTYVYSKHKSMEFETETIEKLEYEEIFLLDILNNYETDELRRESKKETEEIHENIKKAYQEFGYEPIKVPEFKVEKPIEKRANFVLEKII